MFGNGTDWKLSALFDLIFGLITGNLTDFFTLLQVWIGQITKKVGFFNNQSSLPSIVNSSCYRADALNQDYRLI